jgi:hypothetical protein
MKSLLDAEPLDLAILELLVKVSENDAPPSMLYHYTDFDGLKGIVESHSLRATYTRTLNDSTEQQHGESLVCRVLQNMVRDNVREKIATGMKQRFNRSFVTCFCADPNLLSMWRAYALRGGGYCLGFDSSELRTLVHEQSSKTVRQRYNWLFEIVYGEPGSSFRQSLQELAGYIEQDPARSLGFTIARILASKIKHEAFSEEHEWRIIIQDPSFDEMNYRQGHNYVVPYVDLRHHEEHHGRLLPLRKVVCGPTLRNDDELHEIVGWMLTKYGYEGVEVETCDIPYRL